MLVSRKEAGLDPNNNNLKLVMFNKSNLVKGVEAHPSSNLIIEVQVPRPSAIDGAVGTFVSLGWTVFNIFDYNRDLVTGIWKLPIYQAPIEHTIDMRDIDQLKPVAKTLLCFRVAHAQDNKDQMIKFHSAKTGMVPNDYTVPEVHERHRQGFGSDSDHSGFSPSQDNAVNEIGLSDIHDS